jgi:iron complex outermembrane receptor protein
MGGSLNRSYQQGWAIFGEATLSLTDRLDFTFGVRHHDQDLESEPWMPGNIAPQFTNMDFAQDPLAGTPSGNVTPASFDKSTGRLALQYQFTDDIMAYASFSQGFNSGGATFVTIPGSGNQQLFSWEPETLENYEFGIRSDLADGRIRFNATVFFTEWDDIQSGLTLRLNGVDLPGTVTQNIGRAEATGSEFELTYLPTDNFTVNFNLGLLDTKFKDIYIPTENAGGFRAGETEFSQAPDTTANLGFQYDAGLSNGGTFTTRVDYTYSAQYWRHFDPTLRTDWYTDIPDGFNAETGDFGLLNARFTYRPAADNFEFSVFGTNLTNEYILNSGFFHGLWGFDFATIARPREAGVSFKVNFD